MKMKFGAIVVAGSGKIGGHVASRNRGGAYLRTKTTPNNPQTVAQQTARALLGALSSGWSGLTPEQRLGWNDAVSDFATTDIFGDIRNPSGLNLYVKLNTNLTNADLATLDDVPIKVEVPFSLMTTATYDLSDDLFNIGFATADYDGLQVLVFATPPLSQGTSFIKNRLRLLGSFQVVGGAIEVSAEYQGRFGIPADGANVTVKVVPVVPTGQAGVGQTFKALVKP